MFAEAMSEALTRGQDEGGRKDAVAEPGWFPAPGPILAGRAARERITPYAAGTLDGGAEICKLRFSAMATQPNPLEETLQDFQFPQREAAFFYGLFLRGHPAEELRRDIAVPATVLAKWDRETEREPRLRPLLERIVEYRRHVLAIFENLIGHDAATQKLQ
jgi:hypothetical protein